MYLPMYLHIFIFFWLGGWSYQYISAFFLFPQLNLILKDLKILWQTSGQTVSIKNTYF